MHIGPIYIYILLSIEVNLIKIFNVHFKLTVVQSRHEVELEVVSEDSACKFANEESVESVNSLSSSTSTVFLK